MAFSIFSNKPVRKGRTADQPDVAKSPVGADPTEANDRPLHDVDGGASAAALLRGNVAVAPKGQSTSKSTQREDERSISRHVHFERDITVTGSFRGGKRVGGRPSAGLADPDAGLCPILENAALLYASAQAPSARQLLIDGLQGDLETQRSVFAWLALFDLFQRAGERDAYDRLAGQFTGKHERSAPAWEDVADQPMENASAPNAPTAQGVFSLKGQLSGAARPQVDLLVAATGKQPNVALNLGGITQCDNAGAKLLADTLQRLRRQNYPLRLIHVDTLRAQLQPALRQGREAGEGIWLLVLELLQWTSESAIFEDLAVDFAVAFEISPPSWEPAVLPTVTADESIELAPVLDSAPTPARAPVDALTWEGTMVGPSDAQVLSLDVFAEGKRVVAIDLSKVERIDFVCAGSILNAMNRMQSQRRAMLFAGASPIIKALLILVGISARHFVERHGT